MPESKNCYVFLLILTIIIGITLTVKSVGGKDAGVDKGNSIKYRVGYIESESFVNYAGTLYGLLEGLNELGWLNSLEDISYLEGQNDTSLMWKWLSQYNVSSDIEFVDKAYYSLLPINDDEKGKIIEELNKIEKNL